MRRTSWKIDEIKEKLIQHPFLMERAITSFYQYQTENEKHLSRK